MKNAKYCIEPENERVDIFCRSVEVFNEFSKMGFETRSQFINVVQRVEPEKFGDYKRVLALQNFYVMRKFDEELIAELENIIEKLKSE